VEVAENFPGECRYVLLMLGQVYGHDAEVRERGLTPEQRLRFHQERSGPVMDQLHGWLEAQSAERKTEPNSGLGKAITYMLRHWKALTTFLREAGAPLDNNVCERALKPALLHRKNALFYRTLNGVQVGDLFMSLIHTCQLCGPGVRPALARWESLCPPAGSSFHTLVASSQGGASLPGAASFRYPSKVRPVCVNRACTDPCGGCEETRIPTATSFLAACPIKTDLGVSVTWR
jgi:hypothetical protein